MAGAEVAFFSMASKDLSNLSKKYGKQADQILALLEQPRRLLATILIANSFINIAVVALTYSVLHPFHLPALIEFLVEIVAITFILVLFGEVMPKVYATQH
ncbi:MAG: gliding motility protein GldE, partial [Bacteroidota bacterium]